MAKFLDRERVEEIKQRVLTQRLAEYESYLDSLAPGEWGAIALDKGESQRAVKRRLTTAARSRGRQVQYKRSEDGVILFTVH